jgi:hypothetical protein
MPPRTCFQCGTRLDPDDTSCPSCGTRLGALPGAPAGGAAAPLRPDPPLAPPPWSEDSPIWSEPDLTFARPPWRSTDFAPSSPSSEGTRPPWRKVGPWSASSRRVGDMGSTLAA